VPYRMGKPQSVWTASEYLHCLSVVLKSNFKVAEIPLDLSQPGQ
jgi:hypothetical protein